MTGSDSIPAIVSGLEQVESGELGAVGFEKK